MKGLLSNGKPELLIPASSLEVLKVAVIYGADAVYIGGDMYGLRAKAKNFSPEDMKEGVSFAHEHGKRVFVTANITAHNGDLEGIRHYFEELKEIGPDALIISDPGVLILPERSVRRLRCISVPRATMSIMAHICSGSGWGQSVWYPPESFLSGRLRISGHIFPMIWRLKPLYTVPCVFLIPADVF